MSHPKKVELVGKLFRYLGGRYSRDLGIKVDEGVDEEIFKWFLASILYGARISEKIASKTFRKFMEHELDTPGRILEAGWDRLVEVLDEGGYVRYDFKTADKLLEVMGNLTKRYGGRITKLYEESRNQRELEDKIMSLGKGIGKVTTHIFLRELRETWAKCKPKIQFEVLVTASRVGLIDLKDEDALREAWEEAKVEGYMFSDLEAALLKLYKNFCRKGKCNVCHVAGNCVKKLGDISRK